MNAFSVQSRVYTLQRPLQWSAKWLLLNATQTSFLSLEELRIILRSCYRWIKKFFESVWVVGAVASDEYLRCLVPLVMTEDLLPAKELNANPLS